MVFRGSWASLVESAFFRGGKGYVGCVGGGLDGTCVRVRKSDGRTASDSLQL
jgi:hypothetical protein